MIVGLNQVQFGYDDKIILEGIDAVISAGDRIGLIGRNGAGKSTLLKLILRQYVPDSGEVFHKSGLKIGFLAQNSGLERENSVYEEMRDVFRSVYDCEARMRALEQHMSTLAHDTRDYLNSENEYNRCVSRFEAMDGYQTEVKIRTVLNGMGFQGRYDSVISHMSGGEKTRLALAKLLLEQPELLILDEPTNHLDFSTLQWLENYLADYKGSLLIVSHDRYFLDKTVTRVWELQGKRLTAFKGNYTKYKQLKRELYERRLKEYEAQQEKIAKLQDYVDRNIVRATTAKSAKSRVKQLENMELLEKPLPPERPPVFRFSFSNEPVKEVLEVGSYRLQVADRELIAGVDITLHRGEKLALIGANGTGKSTLLKQLLASFDRETPGIRWGKNVEIAYYDQENLNLNFENTVLYELWNRHSAWEQHKVRGLLANLNLSAEDIEKKVSVLSGGERAKMGFAILMAEHANTLILDEPTNHLDLESREALEDALKEFSGTVLFVSHDRYFLNAVAQNTMAFADGQCRFYEGNYDDYIEATKSVGLPQKSEESAVRSKTAVSGNYRSAKQRAELVKARASVKEYEAQISRLEQVIERLNIEISDPEVASDYEILMEKCRELEHCKAELDQAYACWEEAAARLEELNG